MPGWHGQPGPGGWPEGVRVRGGGRALRNVLRWAATHIIPMEHATAAPQQHISGTRAVQL